MISILNSGEYYHKLVENKKFIWFIYPKKVHETKVLLRPFFDKENDKFKGENILEEFNNLFPNVIIYESYFEDVIDDLIDLGLDVDSFYDERNKMFTPLFIKFKNGWINDTSKNHCYCPQTLTEFIFDLYPEYIPSE
jgi:hypothetical protein